MKRFSHSMIAAAMVSLAFISMTSCQKEEGVLSKQPSNKLSAKVINPSSTKTTYTAIEGGTKIDVNWASSDKIVLYKSNATIGADEVVFTLESTSGQAEGIFALENSAQAPDAGKMPTANQYNWEAEYVAFYPSSAQQELKSVHDAASAAETFLGQFTQQQQSANDNMDHLAKYDLMKAVKAAKDDELEFSHQVAVLKMIVQVPSTTGDDYSQSTDYSDFIVDNITVRGLWGARAYQVSFGNDSKAIDYTRKNNAGIDLTYKVVIGYITVPATSAAKGDELSIDMMMHHGSTSPTFKSSHKYTSAVSYQAGKVYTCEVGMTDPYSVTEFVDLGLPSGTLWAKSNLGASTQNPEGHYFQWGEVNGFKYKSNTRMVFNPSTKTYTEVAETINDASCILNDAYYDELYAAPLNFRKSSFTIDKDINPWYNNSKSYTGPDYQGIIAQYPIKKTVTEVVYEETTKSYSQLSEQYGTDDGVTFYGIYYDYILSIWKKSFFKSYSGTRYERKEISHEEITGYKTVGDAASYQLGEAWHMPAAWQIAELLKYTTQSEKTVNGKPTLVFTSKVSGYETVSMDISNSSGWEEGSWTSVKNGECRFQTTTAAKLGDNEDFGRTGDDENYCWEFHYVTSNGGNKVIGIHSHHTRSTAVPIRPVAVLQVKR